MFCFPPERDLCQESKKNIPSKACLLFLYEKILIFCYFVKVCWKFDFKEKKDVRNNSLKFFCLHCTSMLFGSNFSSKIWSENDNVNILAMGIQNLSIRKYQGSNHMPVWCDSDINSLYHRIAVLNVKVVVVFSYDISSLNSWLICFGNFASNAACRALAFWSKLWLPGRGLHQKME